MDDRCNINHMARSETGKLDLSGELNLSEQTAKFTTKEYFTVLSHGIFDHVHKFKPNAFTLYIYLLCNAKKKDPGAGLYSFRILEIIEIFSNPRDSADNPDNVCRFTACKFLAELERINLIEIVSKPTGPHNAVWQIEICKFKTFKSFLCVQNKYHSGVNDASLRSDGSVTEENSTVSIATERQTEIWQDESEERRGVKNDAPSRSGDARDNNSILYKYVDSLKEPLRKIKKKYLYDLFEELRSSKKSSEEILDPELACRWTQEAMKAIQGGSETRGLKHIRNEMLRLYWNGLRSSGRKKCIFDSCQKMGDMRQKLIATRFANPFFRAYWAKALVEIKNSPYCRGENGDWEASFQWFIKTEKPVVNAMDGRYRDRSKPKRTQTTGSGGIVRNVSGQDYLKGASLGSVQDFDLEDWIEANPEAAEEAGESGLLKMRLDNRADAS